jgi:hypothetical protein
MNPRFRLPALGVCLSLAAPLAQGAQRTFVSTTGNDGGGAQTGERLRPTV